MNELSTFFSAVGSAVEAALEKLIPPADAEPKALHEGMRWSVFGNGKRFRPALLVAAGEAFGEDPESLIRTAAAVEMIHTYSLIHDDLPAMDNDDLRRGRETCHVKFGEATAILAGDALQALAFQVIADDEQLAPATRLQLTRELAIAAGKMVAGQQADLTAETAGASVEELETIHKNKTGALICYSARAGAIIANASREDLHAVTKYSAKLGLLFQVTDDILDVTQTTQTLGKTAAKDVTAGKATYPGIFGIEGAADFARRVHSQALEELDRASKPADRLRAIADFILTRTA